MEKDNLSMSERKKSNLVQGELANLEALRPKEERTMLDNVSKLQASFGSTWKTVKKNPSILIFSIVIFAVLCSIGIVLIIVLSKEQEDDARDAALDAAIETGNFFSGQLDQAILPLFSLAQFATEIEDFRDLPKQIGPSGDVNSLPFLPPSSPGLSPSHRNVTGVCDDVEVLERFNKIATTVKDNAKMDGILVNLQMLPYQVVCLTYPLINTEDFPEGVVMNNTGAVGLDLIAEPTRHVYAKNVMESEDIYIIGPVTLRECSNGNKCDVSVEQAFIAALPVDSDDDVVKIDGVEYPKWGSVEAIINWNVLVEKSGLYKHFEEDGRSFRLTRTDRTLNPETGTIDEELVVLAETPNIQEDGLESVKVSLDTTDDEWEMTVFYESPQTVWFTAAIVTAVIGSLLLAAMAFIIMVQKENLRHMQKLYMEDLAHPQKLRLRQFLDDTQGKGPTTEEEDRILKSKPIAELFPSTTVLYADVFGFSGWASEREPFQVFSLLQIMVLRFDKIARKRDVLKIELQGDVYVACCGIPDTQPDHAVRMTKFAQECITAFKELTKSLERTLGPETGDLRLRVGLSSGPSTAGVLNGESSRFQLFGDTVQIASRMMDTSLPGRVHLSKNTTTLLLEAGKKRWIQARRDLTMVKGQGEIQSYWLVNRKRKKCVEPASTKHDGETDEESDIDLSRCSERSDASVEFWDDDDDDDSQRMDAIEQNHVSANKEDRLIEWQVESAVKLLKQIIAYRKTTAEPSKAAIARASSGSLGGSRHARPYNISELEKADIPLDEVEEVIKLPDFDPARHKKVKKLDSIKVPEVVVSQLRGLITKIAGLYHSNPFHNFEHACHVVMSVHKLLSRIVTPEDVDYVRKMSKDVAADLHAYTFGITSDPLTHFAVVFSALVHDVDHRGVSNGQLAKEIPGMAQKYKDKSIAEQNSVDIAWNLLLEPDYKDLRDCIFPTQAELIRFRQLLVNVVLATDIFDPELKALRNMRWDKAFHHDEMTINTLDCSESSESSSSGLETNRNNSTNRKATIVIEHIIQASDVAHTMQHWNIYKKWNERLFQEMYVGYKMGRAPKDPSTGWYKGELWFFDNYVIPLSRKLEECGVFGVASDECLFNALENRRMWAMHGEEVVEEMLRCVQKIPIQLDTLDEGDEDLGE